MGHLRMRKMLTNKVSHILCKMGNQNEIGDFKECKGKCEKQHWIVVHEEVVEPKEDSGS